MGNIFVTIGLKNRHIFDADTKFAGQIDAGFCGSHCVFGHGIGVAGVGIGCFVDLEAQTVAVAMAEIGTVASLGDQVPGGGINIRAGHTGPGNCQTCQLCLQKSL